MEYSGIGISARRDPKAPLEKEQWGGRAQTCALRSRHVRMDGAFMLTWSQMNVSGANQRDEMALPCRSMSTMVLFCDRAFDRSAAWCCQRDIYNWSCG